MVRVRSVVRFDDRVIALSSAAATSRPYCQILAVNACMNLFGLLMEVVNQYTTSINWLPFWFGCFAGLWPWVMVALMYFLGGGNYDKIPVSKAASSFRPDAVDGVGRVDGVENAARRLTIAHTDARTLCMACSYHMLCSSTRSIWSSNTRRSGGGRITGTASCGAVPLAGVESLLAWVVFGDDAAAN